MCRGLAASAKLEDEITFQRTHRATTSVKDRATHLYVTYMCVLYILIFE